MLEISTKLLKKYQLNKFQMRTKINLIIVAGLLTAILPFLGFPQKFKNLLFLLFGVLVFISAYLIARKNALTGRASRIEFETHALDNSEENIRNPDRDENFSVSENEKKQEHTTNF